jgi:prepilin-type N-terminal cleavage/methylation domain-containing protein
MTRHPSLRRARRSGFTLLEVMMAAAIMLLALAGMTQVVISGTEMLDVSKKQTIASQMIRAEIDRVHHEDWNTVYGYYLAGNASQAIDSTLNASTDLGYPELLTYKNTTKGFSIARTIAYANSRADQFLITYTVTWTGNTGRSYSRKGTTYFGKNGLNVTYRSP